jgi:hypothetical protein
MLDASGLTYKSRTPFWGPYQLTCFIEGVLHYVFIFPSLTLIPRL